MEDILASIKKVIAEEKDLRGSPMQARVSEDAPTPEDTTLELADDDVLELAEPLEPPLDLGPPLVDQNAAETSRHSLDRLSSVAATAPPPPEVNPLEELVREMLRPILKQWLDDHLPSIVDEHVKREITRITGRRV